MTYYAELPEPRSTDPRPQNQDPKAWHSSGLLEFLVSAAGHSGQSSGGFPDSGLTALLGGSWVVISGVVVLITLLITTLEPPSSLHSLATEPGRGAGKRTIRGKGPVPPRPKPYTIP